MKAATRHIAQRLSFVPNAGRYSGALTGKNNPAESIIVVFKPKTSGEKANSTMYLSAASGEKANSTMYLLVASGERANSTMYLLVASGEKANSTMYL